MIGKDKILDRPRIDIEIAIEEVTIGKILVETMVGIHVDKTLEETIAVTEVDQEKEALHPEGMVIGDINSQNTSSGTRSRSNSRVTTNRDRISCFNMQEA